MLSNDLKISIKIINLKTKYYVSISTRFIRKTIPLALMILNIFSCSHSEVRREIFPAQTYISYSLPYDRYRSILGQLEATLGLKLKNRGEAHITIITPPEYSQLKKIIPEDQFKNLSNELLLKKPSFKEVCIGEGRTKDDVKLKTYYIVLESAELFEFRRKLSEISKLSIDQFNPNSFYPHITLGFTEKDLHEQDGVIKSKASCLTELQPLLNKSYGKPLNKALNEAPNKS